MRLLPSKMNVSTNITVSNLQGILRAGIVGITSGNFSEGASTLTQQLIKNNVFPNFLDEKTFYDRFRSENFQEQVLAMEIEKLDDQRRDSGSLYEHDQPWTELPRRCSLPPNDISEKTFQN